MIRVLPVPGGPWISVMGCFSSAALRAVSWLSARVRRNEKDERVSIHRSGCKRKNCAGVQTGSPLRSRRMCSEKPHVFFVIKGQVHNLLSKISSSAHGDGHCRGGTSRAGAGEGRKKRESFRAEKVISPLYADSIAFESGSGSSQDECAALAAGLPPRMVCANGSAGNACSASHSLAMVLMFARCIRYQAFLGVASAFRMDRKLSLIHI